MEQNKPLVITISRQLGSGGAYIGQQLAKKLSMYYADHEIITKTAEELSVLEKDLASQEEKIESFWKTFLRYNVSAPEVYIPASYNFFPTSEQLFETESEVIKRIADESSSVILGRCGFDILREHPNKVSVLLYSNIENRIKRIQDFRHLTEEEARKTVSQSDKDRELYINSFTKKKWMDARNFDLCIDTGKISFDKCVDLIIAYLNSRG